VRWIVDVNDEAPVGEANVEVRQVRVTAGLHDETGSVSTPTACCDSNPPSPTAALRVAGRH
jgi:hypothetical protein